MMLIDVPVVKLMGCILMAYIYLEDEMCVS